MKHELGKYCLSQPFKTRWLEQNVYNEGSLFRGNSGGKKKDHFVKCLIVTRTLIKNCSQTFNQCKLLYIFADAKQFESVGYTFCLDAWDCYGM